MKKLAFLLILMAGIAGRVSAQGSLRTDRVQAVDGRAMGGQSVTVCTYSAGNYTNGVYTGTVPCTATVSVYYDPAETQPIAQPLTTNSQGNYSYAVAAGNYTECVTGPNVTGSCQAVTVGGTGSGGGNPGGTDTQIQCNKTGNFSGNCMAAVNNSTSPTQFNVLGDLASAGPRPYGIDITAPPYNCDPNGSVDATSCIQQAINIACSSAPFPPSIYFPFGFYKVTQPQGGSGNTTPIFNIPCPTLNIQGSTGMTNTIQGSRPPEGAEIFVNAGANPGAGPVFQIDNSNGGSAPDAFNVTISNLGMICYNKCIYAHQTSNNRFENLALSVQTTGYADNSPLHISNEIWTWINHTQLVTGTGVPTLLLTGDTPSSGGFVGVGLLFIDNVNASGDGFKYIQRVAQPANSPGSWFIRNTLIENNTDAGITLAESSPGLMTSLTNVKLDDFQVSDGAANLLNNTTGAGAVNQLFVVGSGPGVVCLGNAKSDFTVLDNLSAVPSDCSNGFPMGSGLTKDSKGYDLVEPSLAGANRCVEYLINCSAGNGNMIMRFYQAEDPLAILGIDPYSGYLLGDGVTHAFGSVIGEDGFATIANYYNNYLPPTNFAGTAVTGGSLANGSYSAVIWTYQGANISLCNNPPTDSPFVYGAPVSVTGSNNAINFSWTPPSTASPRDHGTISGYCMAITTTNRFGLQPSQALQITNPAATSFLYTGQAQTNLGNIPSTTPAQLGQTFSYNSMGLVIGGFSGLFTHANTANRTYTLPDQSGTLCLTSTCSGGSSLEVQTNGTDNTLQSLLNFTTYNFNGLTFTPSNPSGGIETYTVSGLLANAGLANSAVTFNGQTASLGGSNTLTLASSNFANQGTSVHTLLHGNPAGNPSWGAVDLTSDVSGLLPNGNLANPSMPVNGTSCTLGTGCTVTAVPSGSAGGDLSGTYPNPTVAKINGNSVPSGAANNQVLVGTSPSTFSLESLVDCHGGSNAENYTAASHTFSCNTISTLVNPMTTIGDRIGGGASGTPTRIAGGLTGQVDVASNGAVGGFASSGLPGRTVSGTTDIILCDSATAVRDRGTTITYTSTSNVAITVPSAAATGCGSNTQGDNNFYFATLITPASGSATYTFTPTTSTLTVINGSSVTSGATSLVLSPGQYASWSSPDNVNYLVRLTNGAPSGSAGGALAGTYPNPTLANATSCTNQVVTAINASTAAGACSSVALTDLATQSADTMVANMTASTAVPTAVAIPTTAHTVWLAEGTGTAPSSAGPGTSGQVLASQGSSTDPHYIDFPERYYVPAANCNNATGGAGWSIGSGGTVSCRAGTNNLGGYIAITDTSSTFATFQVTVPEDWDTSSNPYVRFYVASTDATNAHTIIPEINVACYKGDLSTTDDVAANGFHSSSTVTLNGNANLFSSQSNVQMNSTDVTGCVAGALMQITVGRATDTASNAEFYGADVTFPRLIAVQAN